MLLAAVPKCVSDYNAGFCSLIERLLECHDLVLRWQLYVTLISDLVDIWPNILWHTSRLLWSKYQIWRGFQETKRFWKDQLRIEVGGIFYMISAEKKKKLNNVVTLLIKILNTYKGRVKKAAFELINFKRQYHLFLSPTNDSHCKTYHGKLARRLGLNPPQCEDNWSLNVRLWDGLLGWDCEIHPAGGEIVRWEAPLSHFGPQRDSTFFESSSHQACRHLLPS